MSRSCESSMDIEDKENLPMVLEDGSGVTSTSDEPLQTRKRKKGSGCNVRKSLAWNKAFLTEEGILNPLELSVLSGSFSRFSKNVLSEVKEVEGTSPASCSRLNYERSDLRSLDEKIFKEDEKLSASSTESESSAHDNSHSVGSKKVPSKSIKKRIPQGGACPRPPASHSQKKPTRSNQVLPIANPSKSMTTRADSSSLLTTAKSTVLARRHLESAHQNVPAAVNFNKNVGMKSYTENTKNVVRTVNTKNVVHSNANSASSVNLPACSAKHVVSQTSGIHLSSNPQLCQVAKDTVDLEVISGPKPPVNTNLRTGQAVSGKVAVSLTQNAPYVAGSMIPHLQNHAKPSGLRMPSPTFGYFCQAKAASLHCNTQSQRNSPCSLIDSNIPQPSKLPHIRTVNPLHAPARRPPKIVSNLAAVGTVGAINSGSQPVSVLKCSIPSIPVPTSIPILKSKLEPKIEAKTSSESCLQSKPEPKIEPKTSSKSGLNSKSEPKLEVKTSSESGLEPKSDQKIEVKTSSESGTLLHNQQNSCEEQLDASCLRVFYDNNNEQSRKKNMLPFSDEWVSALEAAGEEILKMKTGAVQNSPPEKIVIEPGPYSPVKRKSQEIGPFNCTKFTSLPPVTQ